MFQAILDLRWDAVARLYLPSIEPNPEAIVLQLLRDGTHHDTVLRAVAQEHVEIKICDLRHDRSRRLVKGTGVSRL